MVPNQNLHLPINDVLPQLTRALSDGNRLILAAPPGAGKTTGVPLALLSEPWMTGRILLLEPRRIAARLAAERMAATLGEAVGQTVGLSTRVDRKVSKNTRIEVITDGLFTRRVLSDPALTGVSAVLFDEFHERSLNLDLGLALARDAQGALREDLRLVVMSATLDVDTIRTQFDAPVVESDGRMFPVETIYLGRDTSPLPGRMAIAIRRALTEQEGSLLCFLPGQGEIRRSIEALDDLSGDIDVVPLFGALSPKEQDHAVTPSKEGRRKVVVATDIAESSLTIEGVRVVIDGGYARRAEYDPTAGTGSLVTTRVSKASADQRRGRAGRTEPGVCYRLWGEAETKGLPPAIEPEILHQDLSSMALALREWGVQTPDEVQWITPPPAGRYQSALGELSVIGALDDAGGLTTLGKAIAQSPLEPRLAALIAKTDTGQQRLAARIALLVSERGLGGNSTDLSERLSKLARDKSSRAKRLSDQSDRWVATFGGDTATPIDPTEAGQTLARGWPLRIARRISIGQDAVYQLANGRRAALNASDALCNHKWLAVADATGVAAKARILLAAPLSEEDALASDLLETTDTADYDEDRKSVVARRTKRLGAILLQETPLPAPDDDIVRTALSEAIASQGLDLLKNAAAISELQARLAFLNDTFGDWALLDGQALLARRDDWLTPLLDGPRAFETLSSEQLTHAVLTLMDYAKAQSLDRLAPRSFALPTGRRVSIDYLTEGGPQVTARAQEFFGGSDHPSIADGRVPLSIVLLSPAKRPIATTTDLPGFWRGSYKDMAKDMRSRYPKHDWPDDPAAAKPHEGRTKARLKG